MFKVSKSCGYHAEAMCIGTVHTLLVTDTASRLNHSSDTFIGSQFHTVGEWEEGVTCHHSTVQVETEALGFLDGLLQGIHSAGLSHTACQKLLALTGGIVLACSLLICVFATWLTVNRLTFASEESIYYE